MHSCVLPLVCVLVGGSAALPEAIMGHVEELDLTPHVIFNQSASQQLQEEQRGVEEGVRSILMEMANLTDLVSTHLTLDDRYMQDVKEWENATRRLLDTLDQLESVNKDHQADNLKLKQENTRLDTTIYLVEEDNRKTKNEVHLVQEIVLLKSQIRQVEEDSRLAKKDNRKTKNEVRLAQEDNIKLKSQIRQVEEDARLAKERIRVLEFAETQAQDRNNAASTRFTELERQIQLLQETNNMTEGEKRHVEDQLSLLEKEKRDVDSQLLLLEEQVMVLQTSIAALEEDKEGQAQKINSMENQKNRTEVKRRLMEEEHQECKRNVSELSARLLPARDCAEIYCKGARRDGVYLINPGREVRPVFAWCDMTTDGGGWTVFVKRDTRVVPEVNFARKWKAYKTGFGDPSTEYWLGTEAVHQLTQPSPQTLRLTAADMNKFWLPDRDEINRWALWSTFSVADESTGYQLLVDGYQEESTMWDVLSGRINVSGMKFSTMDRDNDLLSSGSCARIDAFRAGWWFRNCSNVTPTSSHRPMIAFYWTPGVELWMDFLQELQLMTRPHNFPTCHQ